MSERAERLAKYFLAHRRVTEDLAARIPDDRVDYAPWPGALGVGRLLLHIADAHHALTATAAGHRPERSEGAAAPSERPAIRGHLGRLAEDDAAAIRSLTDEQLRQPRPGVTGSGRALTLTAEEWLMVGREHEAHHKGQLFTYARMNGVEPPGFIRP